MATRKITVAIKVGKNPKTAKAEFTPGTVVLPTRETSWSDFCEEVVASGTYTRRQLVAAHVNGLVLAMRHKFGTKIRVAKKVAETGKVSGKASREWLFTQPIDVYLAAQASGDVEEYAREAYGKSIATDGVVFTPMTDESVLCSKAELHQVYKDIMSLLVGAGDDDDLTEPIEASAE
jgi:hypothetical protein